MPNSFSEIKNENTYKYLVSGQWLDSKTGQTLEIKSPIDDSLVGAVQALSQDEVDKVVNSCSAVQRDWQKTPVWERAEIMHDAGRLLLENLKTFRDLLILEVGKPKKQAEDEVLRTAELFEYYAQEAVRFMSQGELLDSSAWPHYTKHKKALVEKVPLGVVLAISPFNYPLNESAPKIIAALLAGNTCVFKPSTQGAITGLHLAQIFQKAGLAKGVLGIVTGKTSDWGDFLLGHSKISCLNFTGSSKTAERIFEVAKFKKLVLGLSGKDAAIVLPDADLDLTVSEISSGAFSYSAQRCTAIKRVLVLEEAEEFVKRLTDQVKKDWVLGDPRQDSITLGPVISDQTADYVWELYEEAVKLGAKVLCGGKRKGRFIEATVLDQVSLEAKIAWEEPFGPVLPIIRVKNIEEAIEIANRSEYGLQSCVFTRDLKKALEIAQALEVGTVQINAKDQRSPDHFPFLGVKKSGLGLVQGAKYLLSEMVRPKVTVLNF